MDDKALLGQLEAVADALGLEVRYDLMDPDGPPGAGGLCRIRGKPVVIVNRRASVREKTAIFLTTLRRFDLSGIYLKPFVREELEKDSAPEKDPVLGP